MIGEKKELIERLSKTSVLKMKGQAIPLLSYHLIRDHVITAITGEFQSSILYWTGRNLATKFDILSFEECRDLFLEFGWGFLEVTQSNTYMQTYKLSSPYFISRQISDNESTFALECGFLAEIVGQLEQKDTEGEFKLVKKPQELYVSISIYLQEKGQDKRQESLKDI
jgi:hypothetical protein